MLWSALSVSAQPLLLSMLALSLTSSVPIVCPGASVLRGKDTKESSGWSRLSQCGVCRVDLRSTQAGQVGKFQIQISFVYSESGEAAPLCREDAGGGGEAAGEEEGPGYWPRGSRHHQSDHWCRGGGGGHSLGAQDN